jgi:hypothetical protein
MIRLESYSLGLNRATGDTSNSKYVALRSIHAGGFMDTMEADQ